MIIYDGNGETVEVSGKNVLDGANLIILADSVFDYEEPDGINVGELLALNTGANVYNWAQGGCCMALGKGADYDPYSFVGLANALVDGDFTNQEARAETRNFTEQVAEMKAYDMSTTDFLVVAYGTNDFWRNETVNDTTTGFDTSTYIGAYKYGLRKILSAYPTIKVLCLGLQNMPSRYIDQGSITVYPQPYNDAIKSASADLSIPFLDIWNDSMINEYTKNTLCSGMPHLSHLGKIRYAALIANAFNLYY